jgi:outer membrane protein assembly factor BamD
LPAYYGMSGRIIVVFSLIIALVSSSCNEFSKIQKDPDPNKKYAKAKEYYAKGDYVKAQMLFDELYIQLRNTDKGEDVLYHLAFSNYHLEDYILAGYQFKVFYRSYPLSTKAEECLYMSAYCHYLVSPVYSLDQYDTYLAIDQFQYFVQMFPKSDRVKECNKLIDVMHIKLQKKKFEIAKLYLNINDFKAAITSFNELLREYPDSKYREESMYLLVKAKYGLAKNSIDEKKEGRINDALKQADLFLLSFPESEWTDEVKDLKDDILKLQKEFNDDKKSNN